MRRSQQRCLRDICPQTPQQQPPSPHLRRHQENFLFGYFQAASVSLTSHGCHEARCQKISSLAASLHGLKKYILDYLYHLPLTGVHLGGGGRRRAPEGTRIQLKVFYRAITHCSSWCWWRRKEEEEQILIPALERLIKFFAQFHQNWANLWILIPWSARQTGEVWGKNPQRCVLGRRSNFLGKFGEELCGVPCLWVSGSLEWASTSHGLGSFVSYSKIPLSLSRHHKDLILLYLFMVNH